MSPRESIILTTKILALCGSGILTGGILSISYYAIPAMLLAPSPLAQRQWSEVYDRGRKTMPALALVTSALYWNLSRMSSKPAGGAAVVPLLWHKPSLYLASAGLTLAMVPYTVVFMWNNIHALDRAAHALEKCKAGELEMLKVGGKTTKQLLDQWGMLNLGRALLTGLGFVVGIWGSVLPVGREVFVEAVETGVQPPW